MMLEGTREEASNDAEERSEEATRITSDVMAENIVNIKMQKT
jgi:hypothetical protein